MGEIYPDEEHRGPKKATYKPSSILDQFGTNISKRADDDLLDPVVGRVDEISRMIQILGRRRKNNPVLVGEPGTGKTSVVEGLAIMIRDGRVPRFLQDKTIYTLELTTIVSGTKYRGQFEERMKGIIDELRERQDIIIFIDELHMLMGAGSTSGSMDASNIIKPALARGEIRCIGATTFDEFRKSIESDGALDRRFQKVQIDPSTAAETLEIMTNIRHKYESHHRVRYSAEVIEMIVKMAERYITDRFFPDKGIDIMDEVGSYKNLASATTPKEIKELERKLREKGHEKKRLVSVQDYEQAARVRDDAKQIGRAHV